MKTSVKEISIFLTIFILLQGCSVYNKVPVTIEEAANEGYPVKVKTIDNKSAAYHHIEFKEGEYYGVKQLRERQTLIPLKKGEINSIREKDKIRSIGGNMAIVTPVVIAVLILLGVIAVY